MISSHITGAFVGIVVIGGMLGIPLTDRIPPVDVQMRVLNQEVHPGDMINIENVIMRDRVCDSQAVRVLYDGIGTETRFIPDERAAYGAAGPDYRIVRLKVPDDAVPGTGRYRVTSTFKCNWLHNLWPITVVWPDVPFTIQPTTLRDGG